ncbi:MAG: hypothetical protein KDC97_09145 [Confluentibacter sp.]|jgi:hypothetical protein|nr:hypothetical protein [Confluentibacter sp.]HMR15605.1 hypothetical protein [Mariniflexile sp.]
MKKTLLAILIALISISNQSQEKKKDNEPAKDYSENVASIDATIKSFYTAISGEKGKKRDWALFKFLFHPEAKLITSGKDDEYKFQVRYMKPDDYIKSSGKWMTDMGFIENEIHRTVDAFGNIAHVFSTFEAVHNKTDAEPTMRGINSFQLLNDGKRWWIISIIWDNETWRNPIPRAYLPHGNKQ